MMLTYFRWVFAVTASTSKGYIIADLNSLQGSIPIEVWTVTNLGKARKMNFEGDIHDGVSLVANHRIFQPIHREITAKWQQIDRNRSPF